MNIDVSNCSTTKCCKSLYRINKYCDHCSAKYFKSEKKLIKETYLIVVIMILLN